MKFATFALILTVAVSGMASAQKPVVAAAKCDRVDTTASWFKRQAEWWALESRHDWSNDSLRTALLQISSLVEPHAASGFRIQYGASSDRFVTGKLPVDRLHDLLPPLRQLLTAMASKRQWPLRSTVGTEGVAAVWLVIRGDSALTFAGMHRFMEAGPGEVSPADVAVAEDWLRIKTGRKQIYGTQLEAVPHGNGFLFQPLPTEDLAHVDLRRDAATLPALPMALCWAAKQPYM